MWGLGQDTLLGIDVGLCGASGNTLYWVLLLAYVPQATLYWVLLLVYVGPRATHFTGYCYWLCCASGNTIYWLLVLVYEGIGQHTLLGIVVGYVRFWTTHFTGLHCRSDVGRHHQWVQNNPFFKQ
jgi:hypothetical protein